MRLPRNRRTIALFGVLVFTFFIVLFKLDKLRPSCLFPSEGQSQMVREEKFVQGSDHKNYGKYLR